MSSPMDISLAEGQGHRLVNGLTMKKTQGKPETPFTQILNNLLEERGISVRSAAELAGVGTSTLMSWKAGALPKDYGAVKRLATSLGVTLSFLLTGEDESRPSGMPGVSEVFADGGALFDGYAKITIQRLVPRKKETQ